MIHQLLTLIFLGFLGAPSHSIDPPPTIVFLPTFQAKPLILSKPYFTPNHADSVWIESFKFYCSKIEFYQGDRLVFAEADSYHLVDLADQKSLGFYFQTPMGLKISHVQFSLGIDSLTNVGGAMDGDLDPTKGMYWTWQTGYINFKLEGRSAVCPTRNHEFAFHLGGYSFPNSCLNTVRIPVIHEFHELDQHPINIQVSVDELIQQIDLAKQYRVMSPGAEAKDLSQLAANIFSYQP